MFKNCLDSFSNAGNVCVCVYIFIYIYIYLKKGKEPLCVKSGNSPVLAESLQNEFCSRICYDMHSFSLLCTYK